MLFLVAHYSSHNKLRRYVRSVHNDVVNRFKFKKPWQGFQPAFEHCQTVKEQGSFVLGWQQHIFILNGLLDCFTSWGGTTELEHVFSVETLNFSALRWFPPVWGQRWGCLGIATKNTAQHNHKANTFQSHNYISGDLCSFHNSRTWLETLSQLLLDALLPMVLFAHLLTSLCSWDGWVVTQS